MSKRPLRRYCGRYHSYFRSPTYAGYVFKGLAVIYQHDGHIYSKVLDRYVRRYEAGAPVSVFRMRGTVTLEDGSVTQLVAVKLSAGPDYRMADLLRDISGIRTVGDHLNGR